MKETTKELLKKAGIRALWTTGQTFVGMTGTAVVLTDIHWLHVLSAVVTAGGISFVKSLLTGLPEVDNTSD